MITVLVVTNVCAVGERSPALTKTLCAPISARTDLADLEPVVSTPLRQTLVVDATARERGAVFVPTTKAPAAKMIARLAQWILIVRRPSAKRLSV